MTRKHKSENLKRVFKRGFTIVDKQWKSLCWRFGAGEGVSDRARITVQFHTHVNDLLTNIHTSGNRHHVFWCCKRNNGKFVLLICHGLLRIWFCIIQLLFNFCFWSFISDDQSVSCVCLSMWGGLPMNAMTGSASACTSMLKLLVTEPLTWDSSPLHVTWTGSYDAAAFKQPTSVWQSAQLLSHPRLQTSTPDKQFTLYCKNWCYYSQ